MLNKKTVKKESIVKKNKLLGVGDLIAETTKLIGIKPCSDCEERRKKLNKMFPFTRNTTYLFSEDEISFLRSAKDINKIDTKILTDLYNKVYTTNVKPCNCPSTMSTLLDRLIIQIGYQEIK